MKPNYHVHKTAHKDKKEFTYSLAIVYGVVTELVLVLAQFVFLAFRKLMNQDMTITFSTEYMMSSGFFVFQILGIVVYAFVAYQIIHRYTISSLAFMLVFLVAGGAVELTFYLSIPATYQGAFLYSILDKTLGVAMGMIGYFVMSRPNEF